MKKKYHLKKNVKLILVFMGLGLILFMCISFLKKDEEKSYEKLKTECRKYGTEVVTRYTNQGDRYYVCN